MHITEIKVHGDKDTAYLISVEDEQVSCSCPAFKYHPEKPCKHMRYVTTLFTAEVHATA